MVSGFQKCENLACVFLLFLMLQFNPGNPGRIAQSDAILDLRRFPGQCQEGSGFLGARQRGIDAKYVGNSAFTEPESMNQRMDSNTFQHFQPTTTSQAMS